TSGTPRAATSADPRRIKVLWIAPRSNASFDVRFLTAEFERTVGPVEIPREATVCTMRLASRILRAGRSLADCCAAFDIPGRAMETAPLDHATGREFSRKDRRATAARFRHRGGAGVPCTSGSGAIGSPAFRT